MPHEMKGFAELKRFNTQRDEEENAKYVRAAVESKRTYARMTPYEIGKLQATMYARSMYLTGMSGERCL